MKPNKLQVLGGLIFFGACLAGVLGRGGLGFELKIGPVSDLVIVAVGCGIGGAFTSRINRVAGFYVGAIVGVGSVFLLQGYSAVRGGISSVELVIVSSIVSWIATVLIWRFLNFDPDASPKGLESLERRAKREFDNAVEREVRRRADRYFEEQVERDVAREQKDQGSRTRKQIRKELEELGLRAQMERELHDEVTKELTQRVKEREQAILNRERKLR